MNVPAHTDALQGFTAKEAIEIVDQFKEALKEVREKIADAGFQLRISHNAIDEEFLYRLKFGVRTKKRGDLLKYGKRTPTLRSVTLAVERVSTLETDVPRFYISLNLQYPIDEGEGVTLTTLFSVVAPNGQLIEVNYIPVVDQPQSQRHSFPELPGDHPNPKITDYFGPFIERLTEDLELLSEQI